MEHGDIPDQNCLCPPLFLWPSSVTHMPASCSSLPLTLLSLPGHGQPLQTIRRVHLTQIIFLSFGCTTAVDEAVLPTVGWLECLLQKNRAVEDRERPGNLRSVSWREIQSGLRVCSGNPWAPFSKVVESTLAQVSHIWRLRRYKSKRNQRLWNHHFLIDWGINYSRQNNSPKHGGPCKCSLEGVEQTW